MIDVGEVQLRWETRGGYLRSVLAALEVPVESQIVAFGKNSLQSARLTPQNPRTLFFNDSVAVGSVQGGFIELAAVDPQQGVVFYTLQSGFLGLGTPRFVRETRCLQCRVRIRRSACRACWSRARCLREGACRCSSLATTCPDHRTKLEERWGGSCT